MVPVGAITRVPGRLLERAVIAYWRRRTPIAVPPRARSAALGDNVQQTMNLVMPLADPSPVATAHLASAMSSVADVVSFGLDNVGTVHLARFDIIGDRLCMLSVFDGDFETYIRDFVATIGTVFDVLLDFVVDPPARPVEQHVDEFVDWVGAHDLYQVSGLVNLSPDLRTVPREAVLLFDARPEVQLAAYRSYPGHSVAQIRRALGIGW
jgi:hypothetical protein